MALNFPNSPNDGDVYATFRWDAATTSWVSIRPVGFTGSQGTPGTTNVSTLFFDAKELTPRYNHDPAYTFIPWEPTPTYKMQFDNLGFDASTNNFAQARFVWPAGFTTCTVTFYWGEFYGGTYSGTATWKAEARCFADTDNIDQAFGTAVTVTDTFLNALDLHVATTSALTPSGTVSGGNLTILQISADSITGTLTQPQVAGIRVDFA